MALSSCQKTALTFNLKLMRTNTKQTSNLAQKWQLLKTAVNKCIF